MCGIVGVIVKPNNGLIKQIEDSFYELLFVGTLRGDDSTGVIAVEKDTTFHIAKEAGEAAWFVPQFQHSKIGKDMWACGKALIGHNRKGTVGKVEDASAHPFVVEDEFALVHNGTLWGHEKLAKTTVDSEALAIVLAGAFKEEDYKAALETTLPEVNGAYAVALYDQRHNKVRLLRNKDRPLAIVETSNAWYFASEGMMLQWILARNGYSILELKTLRSLKEDVVVSFDLDTNKMTEEEVSVKKYTPHQATKQGGAGSTGTVLTIKKTLGTKADLSKNMFKKIRKQFMNFRIEWWADDYIETNFPKTFQDGEKLFDLLGDCDTLEENHIVHTTVDVNALKMAPDKLIERRWSGRVIEMDFNPKTKQIHMWVAEASPLPVSFKKGKKPVKDDVIDAAWIERKIDEQEKVVSALH